MIEKGSKVTIKSKGNKTGSVLETKAGFANVRYGNETGWFPTSDLYEATDALLNRLIKNDLDDTVDFVLAMDAYRLHEAQLWEPYVFATSNRIDIFPHQIDEVTWALDNPRTLIADEVGLGKTIIAALTSAELGARGLVNKALYVVPKSLILKWRDELKDKFQLDAKILSSAHERMSQETFRRNEFSYITSIDYLKQDHVKEHLADASIDMVIIDEAHKMKLGTQRLKLGKKLAEITHAMMLLTATPHDGRDEDFLERMKLLDPWITDISSSSHLWVRNIKENVLDINGKQVFPSRKSETVELQLDPAEEDIHTRLDDYMDRRASEAVTAPETNAVRFLRIIFKKRCSSSIRSLEISLNRRLAKLGTVSINDVTECRNNLRRMEGDSDEEDYDEGEFEENLEMAEAYTAARNLDSEKRDLQDLLGAIRNLGDVDSKQRKLVKMIEERKRNDAKAKLVLFTEYIDTLKILHYRLSEKYKVGRIDGTMNIDERKAALDSFRHPDGEEILLCTDAAGEGIDMQFCNVEINYDLPWNPNKLEQRMGRIHRIGQKRPVHYYNFVIDSKKSIDGYIFKKLLEKLERIRDAMDDKIYDVLGRLITEEDISKLYEELSTIPYDKWEPKIMELEEKIEANKERILRENHQLLTSNRFDTTKLADIQEISKHAIDKGEIKRFVETYIGVNGGELRLLVKADDTYRIFLPKKIARDFDYSIIDGTFDKDVAIESSRDYLALGNKNISKILQHAAKPSITCLSHETKSGLLSMYRFEVTNVKGVVQKAKTLCLFQNEDGKIVDVDSRSLWSYENMPKDEEFNVDTDRLVSFSERTDSQARTELAYFEEITRKDMSDVEKKSKGIARNYYSRKNDDLEGKIDYNRENISSGPHIEKIIQKLSNERDELKKKYDERMASIEKEFNIQSTMELVGLAWVVPRMDANIRTEIDRAGMDAVIRDEKRRAETPEDKEKVKDVSDRDTGYDVESFGGRCIEVKSFRTTGSPKITSHEWVTAEKMQDNYWLYVVENTMDDPTITQIQNPHERFKDTAAKEKVINYRYVINDWKTMK